MKRLIVLIAVVAAMATIVGQGQAQDHWYWHLEEGNSKLFENVNDPADQVTIHVHGEAFGGAVMHTRRTINGVLQDQAASSMSRDLDGNIWFHAWCEPEVLPAEGPLLFVKAPLCQWNSWDQRLTWNGVACLHVSTVTRVEDVVVPFSGGVYTCCKLEHKVYMGGTLYQAWITWLHDGAGVMKCEVYNIPGWGDGTYQLAQAVIAEEAITWGGVKDLYR